MLDIQAGTKTRLHPSRTSEFVTTQLLPLAEGHLSVSVTETSVDEAEPQILDHEIGRDRVATVDEVLTLIRPHVRPDPAAGLARFPTLRRR